MRVILSHQAEKFMLALDEKRYTSIREILVQLEIDAVPFRTYDVRKLSGSKTGFRIRKGKIRILYSIEKEINQIFVEKIDWRDETTYG